MRIDVTGGLEHVPPAVIVIIDEARAPGNGGHRDVGDSNEPGVGDGA